MIGSKILDYYLEIDNPVEYTFCTHLIPNLKGYHLDITKKEETEQLIKKINPDIVIHASALVNVDLCETNPQLANSINVKGTENVVEGCKEVNCKLVYISTPLVFDGKKTLYFEKDVPTPITVYGKTKLEGEDRVEDSNLPFLILRTDQPYCWVEEWQRMNSVLRVINTLKAKKIHNEITDWYNNPTYVPDFIHALAYLLDEKITGVFHLVGSDFINRYDWALITAEKFGLDKNLIKPITSDKLNLSAKRSNANLTNEKLFKATEIRMKGVNEGLNEMLHSEKI